MDDAVPSDLEQSLAARFRQSLQGCTQHLHGPVAAFGELKRQRKDQGVRIAMVRTLIRSWCESRQQQLTLAGVSADDPRYRKEQAVAEFSEALLRGAEMSTTLMTPTEELQEAIRPHVEAVGVHPLWEVLTTPAALRVFMEHHVYCVWDFMTLLKVLQRKLTCVTLPWHPIGTPESRRLINEIVTSEESDHLPDGRILSHYELYVEAMREVGADVRRVESFRMAIPEGAYANVLAGSVAGAAEDAGIPAGAAAFLATTFRHVAGPLPGVVASFALGREQVIPAMFRGTLAGLQAAQLPCETFSLYLDRHIEVDGDDHGPMAMALLAGLCRTEQDWATATEYAIEALKARKTLWDAIEAKIRGLVSETDDSDGETD